MKNLKDKIKGCFLGKNIGGTLGMLYEGQEGFIAVEYYQPVPTEPIPNDDLDLQIIWLRCMQKTGLALDNRRLGRAWLDHIDAHPDEYGIALWNLKRGLEPPLTGLHNNFFTDGMGAAIRSEIWACLFPGKPLTAAHYAFQDASVDHWGEGVIAEMFLAAVQAHLFESANFRASLAFGLNLLGRQSKLKTAYTEIIRQYEQGAPYETVRDLIMHQWGSYNFTDCVMNLSFVLLGLLYGEGDFEKTLRYTVNCGQDADCTGATVGGFLGLLLGAAAIPDKWKKPIGEKIVINNYRNIVPPENLDELVKEILALHQNFAGQKLPTRQPPFRLPALPDFSDANPWYVNGKKILFRGIRLEAAKYLRYSGREIIFETAVSFPVSGQIQILICSRGLFRFEFDQVYLGMKGDLMHPVPAFHRIRGGRGYNVAVAKGKRYKLHLKLYPAVPVPDVHVAFGDMNNRHLQVKYHDLKKG